LRFYAINAGYKDDTSSQNYDFIELERLTDADLSLASYRIVYTNSAGNPAGEISFPDNLLLSTDHLVLGAAVSPQYSATNGSVYTYDFGSSGLASTAGKLELYQGEHKIDEICWGKLECSSSHAKFATKQEENYSFVRCVGECSDNYSQLQYYPSLNLESITTVVSESPELPPSCKGVIISEIYSHYNDEASEQFVELYNPTDTTIPLSYCSLRYKKVVLPLSGDIGSGVYYLFRNTELSLVKDPSVSNLVEIIDSTDEIVAAAQYPHGQKKGTSYALFDIGLDSSFWRQTYAPTPGSANIYQEFQTCPEGKVINVSTGNCVKEVAATAPMTCPSGKYLNPLTNRCKNIESSSTLTPCKDGYERNPETNRCRKIASLDDKLTPCADGYERNPETNRCRKIRDNTGSDTDYAPTPVKEAERNNPKIFIAIAALGIALLASAAYVIYQYRQEIRKAIRNIAAKVRRV